MTTIEGNKLIAGFDDSVKLTNERTYKYFIRGKLLAAEGLKYHSSWDWLMPVVQKIESQGQSVSIFRGCCDIRFDKLEEGQEEPEPIESGGGQPKIISTWQSVVKYIQWYNQQNPIQ